MTTTLYLNRDNRVVHQLQYIPEGRGTGAVQNFNLATATEIIAEFMSSADKILQTYTNLSHPGITIVDSVKGQVAFKPRSSDFSSIDVFAIDKIRWVVKSLTYPNGIVFDDPNTPIKVRKV